MGVNLHIYRADGTEHPDWETGRLVGDSDIARLVPTLPCTIIRDDPSDKPDYRPSDFAAWRAAAAAREWPNPGRFEQLIDILELEPDARLSISW